MQKYGTYTTIDCPTQKIDEAFDFLWDEFEKIGGYVRKIKNPHDFGAYPSFEIDTPKRFEDIDLLDDEDLSEEDEKLLELFEEWKDEANAIEEEYNKKFADYL